jgi:signal transduction histidine kinase
MGGVGGQLTAQQKEFLAIIKNNSDRLLTLINDLLDTSKMEQGSFSINKAPAELGFIIDSGIKDLQSLTKNKNITITRQFSPEKNVVTVDAYRISQAVVNLINNAIKFSPPDSEITVRMENHILDDIRIPAYVDRSRISPGYYVSICVIDHGYGIESDKLTRVFDKYYQVENINTRTAQGTGLGLNIVKNIVELHGGAVWTESDGPGKGAQFTLIIPQN